MGFTAQLESWVRRIGLPAELLAILAVVAGILVIAFPRLIEWFVGLLLIVFGVWWLVEIYQSRQRGLRPEESPPPQP